MVVNLKEKKLVRSTKFFMGIRKNIKENVRGF
jgi:hypothetical protein